METIYLSNTKLLFGINFSLVFLMSHFTINEKYCPNFAHLLQEVHLKYSVRLRCEESKNINKYSILYL